MDFLRFLVFLAAPFSVWVTLLPAGVTDVGELLDKLVSIQGKSDKTMVELEDKTINGKASDGTGGSNEEG